MADTCQKCGKAAPAGERVTVAVRATGSGRQRLYAHPACAATAPRRVRCLGFECGERFTANGGPGRPQQYHDDACRRRTDAAIRQATVAVARGKVPRSADKLAATMSAVAFLRACWHGKRAQVDYGRPFPTVEQPPPELGVASARFLSQCSAALAEARAHERAEQAAANEEADRRRYWEIVGGRRARDAQWRERVLAEAAGTDDVGVA